MGNLSDKTKSTKDADRDFEVSLPVKETASGNFITNQLNNKVRFSNKVSLNGRSFGSFHGHNCGFSHKSICRLWSRTSKSQCSERRLGLLPSKTSWPVPLTESLFLPEFKIKNDSSEESFALLGSIATGAFGKVYKVRKKDTNQIYAMKVLSKCQIVATNSVNQIKDEVKIQQMVGHHPSIVNCPYFWQSKKKLFIVSEFISGGELLRLIRDNGPLLLDTIKIYVSEIAIVLDFLHNAGIVYRDLKLENILLDSDNHVQIIDFGLSKWLKYGGRTNTLCGTLQYIAPEVLRRQPYGHAVDWWSLGIVLACMLLGECPYPSSVDENGRIRDLPELRCDAAAADLLRRLLVDDPNRRLHSLSALKRTALFKNFDFDHVRSMPVRL